MGDVTNGEIYNLLKDVLKKTDGIEKEIALNKRELTDEIRNIKSEIKQELEDLKRENRDIKQENQKLKLKLAAIEKKSKKYNLIFYGIEDNTHRFEVETILQIINEKLDLHCEYVDIRDCYKIGKTTEGKTRPTVAEFANHRLKVEILANSRKLKGSGILVQNDYTTEDYQQRKILLENLKIARENGLKAVIRNKVLIVEGEQYTCENLVNQAATTGKKGEDTKDVQAENNVIEDIGRTQTKRIDVEVSNIIGGSSKQHGTDTESKGETRDKLNFKEFVSTETKLKKRKEQTTDTSNQVKRFTRLNSK